VAVPSPVSALLPDDQHRPASKQADRKPADS